MMTEEQTIQQLLAELNRAAGDLHLTVEACKAALQQAERALKSLHDNHVAPPARQREPT